ncbi:MAG: ChuX/HutX family heme-like substrate-binding protein [Acidobacteriota bacterium]|nr:ChuX/HutX family heme-like substrate-binding protein [Acidobacteriota bacterium]
MKGTLKHIAQGALALSLVSGLALAENSCASSEQQQIIQNFFAENPNVMPVMAARALKMPEAIVASSYSPDYMASTTGNAFPDVWMAMSNLEKVTVLITKDDDVFEISSGIGLGAFSDTSPRYNLNHDYPFSGHLRPDLYSSIYAIAIPYPQYGEGKVGRGIFFYKSNGEAAFGILVSGRGPSPSSEQIDQFDEIMAMIEARPSACPG